MKKSFLIFTFLFFLFPVSSFAMSIISNTASWIITDPYYSSVYDHYAFSYRNSHTINKIVTTLYSDSSFSSVVSSNTISAPSGAYFNASWISCDGYLKLDFFSDGSPSGSLKIHTDEIINSTCSGNNGYGDYLDDEMYATEQHISKTLDDIYASMADNHDLLVQMNDTLNSILSSVNQTNDLLGDILSELKTDVPIDSGSVPSVPSIDNVGLEDYKPSEPSTFHDDNTYFSDNGDSNDSFPDVPLVPDPATCWGSICQESNGVVDAQFTKTLDMSPDPALNQDTELSRDSQLLSDPPYQKDVPLTLDIYERSSELTSDPSLQKDSSLNPDSFVQDSPMSKDSNMNADSFSRDSEFSNTDSYSQTNHFSQDPELSVSE